MRVPLHNGTAVIRKRMLRTSIAIGKNSSTDVERLVIKVFKATIVEAIRRIEHNVVGWEPINARRSPVLRRTDFTSI